MTVSQASGTSERKIVSAPPTGLLAGVGAAVGLGALAGSSCCALPLALAGIGATGATFSGLEALATMRPALLASALAALAIGWVLFFRRRAASACEPEGACAAPASSTRALTLLGLGTAFIGLAFVWQPYFEPMALKLFG
jgi:mercuric ion transport protein